MVFGLFKGGKAKAAAAVKDEIAASVAGSEVFVFSKSYCPFCQKATALLRSTFGEGRVAVMELDQRSDGDSFQDELEAQTGGRSVPRVFVAGKFVGGCDDVQALASAGKLAGLLPSAAGPKDIEDESDIKDLNLSCGCRGAPKMPDQKLPIEAGEEVMSKMAHGTTEAPVQDNLRWGCDQKTADRICSFNRHYAEHSGYFKATSWLKEVSRTEPTTYFDSVSGKPLFTAPVGRTFEEFVAESEAHGWPSFRDQEVHWDNVRTLKDGEAVSLAGTHLGHNLPSRDGRNRYCINLVSVAGRPIAEE